jgi:DNA-binding CsgD family transcriptional regulator/PAS domain-containing protein
VLVNESSGSTEHGDATDQDAAGGSHDETDGRVAGSGLGEAVDLLELPITLIDLSDFIIVGASETARRYLAGATGAVVGRSVLDVFRHDDDAGFLGPLRAMQHRDIDFYRAHRVPATSESMLAPVTAWVRSLDVGDERLALAEVAPAGEGSLSPIAGFLGREPETMALGITDDSWLITSISSEITELLGTAPNEIAGKRLLDLVPEDDAAKLRVADQFVNAQSSVAKGIRIRGTNGEFRRLCCVLTALTTEGGRCFILLPEPDPASVGDGLRVAQLAGHLRRISAEVDASGVLQNVGTLPQSSRVERIGELSTRQWEVLARLLRGERVATIARVMFISQSTVRNHLSAIFERFGVHSQAELLALLQGQDSGSQR